jgi:site-specific recombinase XerD
MESLLIGSNCASHVERAPRSRHVPVAFSPEEVRWILAHQTGATWLMASLLYGSGLGLRECCTFRVKDLDLLDPSRKITLKKISQAFRFLLTKLVQWKLKSFADLLFAALAAVGV